MATTEETRETEEEVPTTDPVVEPAAEPEVEPAAEPADPFESFEWDSWDGSVDQFPEEGRKWADRVGSRYEDQLNEYKQRENEVEELKKLWQEMVDQHSDPRVDGLIQKADLFESERTAAQQQYEAIKSQYEVEKKVWEDIELSRARADYEKFRSENEWIFDDGPMEQLGVDLLQEGWEPDHLPKVMKLPKGDLAKARSALKKNPKAPNEILLWIGASGGTSPSSSAEMVSGATSAPVASPTKTVTDTKPLTRRERIEQVAAKKMERLAGRSRRR